MARAVIQSYTVYTPRLARMNADHLRGPAAADCILFGIMPIDGRYPSLEDGLSWPELWSRYEPDPVDLPFSALEYLVLRKAKEARPWRLVPIGESKAEIGSPVEVPAAEKGPVWVELEIDPSLAGRLAETALKCPPVSLNIQLKNGASGEFSLVRKLTGAGFLLSPLIADASWFGWMASTPWGDPHWQSALADRSVRAMTVHTTGPWAYSPHIGVRFFRLEFAPSESRLGAFSERDLSLLQVMATPLRQCNPSLHWVHGQGTVLLAPAGTALGLRVSSENRFFSLPKTARQLHVAFGATGMRWRNEEAGQVGFAVCSYDAAGNRRVLWTKVVPGGRDQGKTTVYEDQIPVDLSSTAAIGFETLQERPNQPCIPFWFGISYQ